MTNIHTADVEVLTPDEASSLSNDDLLEEDLLEEETTPTNVDTPPPELNIDIENFIEDMELGEIELIEEATGLNISGILKQFETSDYSAKILIAIVWLALRRDDPEATMDTARRIKLIQIADVPDDEDIGEDVAGPL